MMNRKKSIGLIGLGYWGKNILRNLYELGVLHSAADSDASVLGQWKQTFRDTRYTTSPNEIIEDPDVAAIAIATPAATHYSLVKQTLLADKDVFVEKPLSLTAAQGKELVELAASRKKMLMVGHILHYHPAVRKLKQLITNGDLGKIEYIYSNRLNIGKLRTEENILWSFAPHDISVMLMLLNEEPTSVAAFGGDFLSDRIYDTTVTTLEFRNGVKGHIFVSWLHPFKEQKLIVVGTKAMAVFDDLGTEKLLLYPHKIEWKNGKIPVAQKADYQSIPFEQGEPLRLELEHFLDCIASRTTPDTDGNEGVRVLKVLEEAESSLRTPRAKTRAGNAAPYFVHESSFVDENVQIGEGTKIWHFSHIQSGAVVGKKCSIGQNVNVGNNVRIGNFVKIQNNVSVYEGVELEDYVFCGPSMVFTNVLDPRSEFPQRGGEHYKKTLVKYGTSIGANATVICGNTIGRFAFIGAGAVVTRDVPDYALIVGAPGRVVGWMCRCGAKLKFAKNKATCTRCKRKYTKKADRVICTTDARGMNSPN